MKSARRALVCAPLVPEFDKESGSKRVFDTIAVLQESGWQVSFVSENGAGGERYERLLNRQGVATYRGFSRRTEQLLVGGQFDLAIFAFWYLAERHIPDVRRLSPETRVAIDTIDLHFVRNARRLFQKRANRGSPLDSAYGDEMTRELNAYSSADGVLSVSKKEAELVNDLIGDPGLAHFAPDWEELAVEPASFADREGILFVGNFRHPPNIEAAEYLCHQIVPRLDCELLKCHPVYIVGNGLTAAMCQNKLGPARSDVKMVGWVPSVIPYLRRCRISVIPLLHGAGTKRKLVQSLMCGTPAVSTSVGIEGLPVADGGEVLVADSAEQFARAIERLVEDERLWQAISTAGRQKIERSHGRAAAHKRWLTAIQNIMARTPKQIVLSEHEPAGDRWTPADYRRLKRKIREALETCIPGNATVLVVSRGDESLLKCGHGRGWHFPRNEDGVYAGHHPVDSAAAVEHLEALRAKGGEFLLFPTTAVWWFDHYREFKQHLDRRYGQAQFDSSLGVLYDLRAPVIRGSISELAVAGKD
jgi:glycosyltransferase involved in cell wall biosynthesis